MKRLTFLVAGLALVVAACGIGAVGSAGQVATPSSDTIVDIATGEPYDPVLPVLVADASGVASTGGTPLPDVAGSVLGDDGSGPLPLASVTTLPDSVQLDFLFELCWYDPCFRDAHFMDPDNPDVGSGVFGAEMPFHVRQGFINNSDEPLGEGFDVAIYVTDMDAPGEFGGSAAGQTVRYTSDYVVRGTSEACGPTYRTQTGPQTCEWFVHEFDTGLPAGRHAMWAVWEAPCSAWVDYGFIDSCDDPNEVMSLFSSGFDSPFDSGGPSYTEPNHAKLSAEEEVAELRPTADH